MLKFIKIFGLCSLCVGLLLFVLHLVLKYHGNGLLFAGFALIIIGVIAFVKGLKGQG